MTTPGRDRGEQSRQRPDLARLGRVFVAVAEERSFGAAAERLGASQPSVSQSVRRLESHLGVELLRRTRDGAVLTSDGRRLLPLARVVARDAEALESLARELAGDGDVLALGIDASAPQALALAAARAGASLAGRVRLAHAGGPELVEHVDSGELDAALVAFPTPLGGLVRGVPHARPRLLAAPAGRVADTAERVPWRELRGLDLVVPPRALGPAAWDALIDLVRERGAGDSVVEVSSPHELLPAVAARGAYAVVDAGMGAGLDSGDPGTPEVDFLELPAAFDASFRVLVHPERAETADGTDLRSALDRALRKANR